MMKRLVIILGFLAGSVLTGSSQDTRGKDNKLEAIKIGYLTHKLNLSTDEAQKFWPLYRRYTDEIRQLKMKSGNLDEISLEEKVVNIRKKYKTEFTHAIPEERVNQFFKEDKEFSNIIRKELQEREQFKRLRQQQSNRAFLP
jgi:hypothetical protein